MALQNVPKMPGIKLNKSIYFKFGRDARTSGDGGDVYTRDYKKLLLHSISIMMEEGLRRETQFGQ